MKIYNAHYNGNERAIFDYNKQLEIKFCSKTLTICQHFHFTVAL